MTGNLGHLTLLKPPDELQAITQVFPWLPSVVFATVSLPLDEVNLLLRRSINLRLHDLLNFPFSVAVRASHLALGGRPSPASL